MLTVTTDGPVAMMSLDAVQDGMVIDEAKLPVECAFGLHDDANPPDTLADDGVFTTDCTRTSADPLTLRIGLATEHQGLGGRHGYPGWLDVRAHVRAGSGMHQRGFNRSAVYDNILSNPVQESGFISTNGSSTDIGLVERVRAELQLHDRAMAASSCGITIADALDPELPLIYINEGFTRITGYPPDERLVANCRFLQRDDRDQESLPICAGRCARPPTAPSCCAITARMACRSGTNCLRLRFLLLWIG